MEKEKIIKIIKYLFIIYCLVLFYILFLYGARGNTFNVKMLSKEHFSMANIVPFRTISDYIERMKESTINTSIVVANLLGNVVLFIPMGMTLPILYGKKFNKLWKVLLFVFCLVLLIEILQFITFLRSADIDDLILNMVGSLIGYGIIKIKGLRKILKLDKI